MRKFGPVIPNYDRLFTVLANSKIQTENNALFQCIQGLINGVQSFQKLVISKLNSITTLQTPNGDFPAEILLGRGAGAPGELQAITTGAGIAFVGTTLVASGTGINQLTGDVTAGPGSGSQSATIPNDTVTYAKMQNVSAASRILGRESGSTGDVEELVPGANIISSTNINLASNVYTPTLFNETNVAASTAFVLQWMRVGLVVTVSGKVSVDPTAAGQVQLGISLPIASNFANPEECGGAAAAPTIASQSAAIYADATNNRARMEWIAIDITNQPMFFSFTYQII